MDVNKYYLIELLIMILFLSLVVFSCSIEESQNVDTVQNSNNYLKKNRVHKPSNAKMTFLNRWVDFESVPHDTLLIGRYDFVNSGKDTLIVRSINPDCTFSDFYLSNERIAPGDSAFVLLELRTGRMSRYLKTYATIETNTNTKFYNLIFMASIE
jgi:hypothetical protein